jgi:hypothetical protein
LPSIAALQRAHDGVIQWWRGSYLSPDNPALPRRFADEARASLPAMAPSGGGLPDLDEVYAAVALKRLRLHQDQQVPLWTGDHPPT